MGLGGFEVETDAWSKRNNCISLTAQGQARAYRCIAHTLDQGLAATSILRHLPAPTPPAPPTPSFPPHACRMPASKGRLGMQMYALAMAVAVMTCQGATWMKAVGGVGEGGRGERQEPMPLDSTAGAGCAGGRSGARHSKASDGGLHRHTARACRHLAPGLTTCMGR